MNAVIEHLNFCGQRALDFAWPMLWQSSVLILVVFALDLLLLRKVRAAVRYSLWLVVLLKLVLPTSFALPTSLAWWLPRHTEPSSLPKPTARPVTIVHIEQNVVLPSISTVPPLLSPAPLRPSISRSAKMLLVSATGSVVLLLLIICQWFRVSRTIRRALSPWDWLVQLFRAVCEQARICWPVRLRLTEQSVSPSLCGILRPVILIPGSLATELSQPQLRAALLHELIHLRRADVLVSFFQSLLQIVYWWHPLVWLANARIRGLREEAVDDAVVLALHEDAEAYPTALLEVAKVTVRHSRSRGHV